MTLEEIEAQNQNTPPDRLNQLAHQNIELARLVATNIAAPDELLTKLYQQDEIEINKALVKNPNTPTEILMKLAIAYPQDLLNNPVWDLLLLSNPNFFTEMPIDTLSSLLTSDLSPSVLLILRLGCKYYPVSKSLFSLTIIC